MNNIITTSILTIHTLCAAFVILTPFIGTNYFMLLHFIIIPFIVLHWYIEDSTCALTLIEYNIRKYCYGKARRTDCYMAKIVEPVYDFKKDNIEYVYPIYIITFALWIITIMKLVKNYKKSNGIIDMLKT